MSQIEQTPKQETPRFRITRKQLRSARAAKYHPTSNKSSYYGQPVQVINLPNGKHKVIYHRPKQTLFNK